MAPPIVEANDATVFESSFISIGNLFSATDPDDAIVSYIVQDFQTNPGSGFFFKDGVALENGSMFMIDATELANVSYYGGAHVAFEGFRIVARDESGNYSDPMSVGRVFTVRSNTSIPHVRAPFITVLANESIEGREFIYGFDPDGYQLTHFRISEANKVLQLTARQGYAYATVFEHRYKTGDQVTISGADQDAFNRTANVVVLNEHTFRYEAPVSLGFATGEIRSGTRNGGHFEVDGVAMPQGETFTITADQVDTLRYYTEGDASDENIFVQGFDGVHWSYDKRGLATTTINSNRPVIQFSRGTTPVNEQFPLKDNFSVTDADQNTMKGFWFYNTSPHAHKGELLLRGVVMPRKTWFYVSAAEMDDLFFETDLVDDEQHIRIRATDGKHLSVPGTLVITSTDPVFRSSIHAHEQVWVGTRSANVQVGSLYGQSDPGPAHSHVEVIMPTNGQSSGALRFQDTPLANGVIHQYSKPEFDHQVSFQTGDHYSRSLDAVYVRELNASDSWSSWEKLVLATEPDVNNLLDSGTSWNGLMDGNGQGKIQVTYSFLESFPGTYETTGGATQGSESEGKHISFFSEQQKSNARLAFQELESIANVQFVEVADSSTNSLGGLGGVIRMAEFGADDATSKSSYSALPADSDYAGDMWFNRLMIEGGSGGANLNFEKGSWGYQEFLHALGTSMGLQEPAGLANHPAEADQNTLTVLNRQESLNGGFPSTFQLYDVAELQSLYGASTTTRVGNDGYSIFNHWEGESSFVATIWDAGGNDTLSANGARTASVVDLRSGQTSSIGSLTNNVTIAYGVEIENAIGSREDDRLLGNGLNNMLMGRKGNDYLFGDVGNDYLVGGEGDDVFAWGVGDGNDIINEQGLAGRDTIQITDFPTVDALEEDFKFRLQGKDLYIDLTIDGGLLDNSIRVVNYLEGGSRIETLELGGQAIDLVNLSSQITASVDTFKLSELESPFGFLVVPV